MRVTNRNQKGTAKHNFREFNVEKASHISKGLIQKNQYFWGNQKITINQIGGSHFAKQQELSNLRDSLRSPQNREKFDTLSHSEQLELLAYNNIFKRTIDNQNQRYVDSRHYEKQRDILDYYKGKKTEPTESILQIGNRHDGFIKGDLLVEIYQDYLKEHDKRYGRNIKLLNAVLHVDEPGASDHIHERRLFIGHNQHGEPCMNKNQALKELGFELPNPNEKEGKHNNRLMAYTQECRELWIECCRNHGIDVEVIPSEPSKHGLDLATFKADREEQRLYAAQDEYERIKSRLDELKDIDQDLQVADIVRADYPEYYDSLINYINGTEDPALDDQEDQEL